MNDSDAEQILKMITRGCSKKDILALLTGTSEEKIDFLADVLSVCIPYEVLYETMGVGNV